MAIIDSEKYAKFDALIRANKASALMALIVATYNSRDKNEIALRLKYSYDLFKMEGAMSYGESINAMIDEENLEINDISPEFYTSNEFKKTKDQFQSHYTMGYEMGIWKNANLDLCDLAIDVAEYKITIREYIGIVFLNLFTYYKNDDGTFTDHHFLYEILKKIIDSKLDETNLEKHILCQTLPNNEKQKEQFNILFNYLIATIFFEKIDDKRMKYCFSKSMPLEELLKKCNLEYENKTREEALEMAKNKESYSRYITKDSLNLQDKNISNLPNKNIDFKLTQKIYYGAPGTGKSYSVSNILSEKYPNISVRENPFVIRTTIHQDYSYFDFIGSLQPDLDEKNNITYTFKPGPFSIALKKAFLNPEKEIILVIEEMSRGNIAAIFGDIFQLLDRVNGFSEYPIDNKLITDYLRKDSNINIIEDKIYMPNNLSIIGTVNTSDQNVNVMDTAFKRRFSFEYVSVDPIKDGNNIYLNSFSFKLGESEFEWIDLYRALNKFIVENLGLNEDKQIGQFFIKFDEKNEDEDNKLQIKDKLLQYLWEDVQNIAISEETIFDKEIKTFGQLYKEFEDKNIFSETFMNVYNTLPKLVDKKINGKQVTNTEEEIE